MRDPPLLPRKVPIDPIGLNDAGVMLGYPPIHSHPVPAPALPDGFLGGFAPLLQNSRVALPSTSRVTQTSFDPRLTLSASPFGRCRTLGYISPEVMVTCPVAVDQSRIPYSTVPFISNPQVLVPIEEFDVYLLGLAMSSPLSTYFTLWASANTWRTSESFPRSLPYMEGSTSSTPHLPCGVLQSRRL
jgi:hypothetical protein